MGWSSTIESAVTSIRICWKVIQQARRARGLGERVDYRSLRTEDMIRTPVYRSTIKIASAKCSHYRLDAKGRITLLLGLLLVLSVPGAHSHEGPPFPIIVDRQVGPYTVSVWTDPDIGIGTFFIVFEPQNGEPIPEIHHVRVGVRPVSGRLEEVVYEAEPQPVRYGERYYAEVEFDRGEFWTVRIVIDGDAGGGEMFSEVEATPDGTIGPIGLVLYALPFLAVAFLWIKAVLRKRQIA